MPGMRTPVQVDWAGNTGQPTRPPADFRTPEEKEAAIKAEGFNEQSKVYFTHFPTNFEVADIIGILTNYGNIRDVQLLRHPENQRFKGSGSARFQTRAQAEACIEGVSGTEFPGCKKPVEVRWAENAEQRSERLNASAAARAAAEGTSTTNAQFAPSHADRQGAPVHLSQMDYNRFPNQIFLGGHRGDQRSDQTQNPHHANAAQVHHHDQMNRHMTATYRQFNVDPQGGYPQGHYGAPHNVSSYSFIGNGMPSEHPHNHGMMPHPGSMQHAPSASSTGSYTSEPLSVRIEPGFISNQSGSWGGSPHGSSISRESNKAPSSSTQSSSSSFSPTSVASTPSMSSANASSGSNHYIAASATYSAAAHGHTSSTVFGSSGEGGGGPTSNRIQSRAYASSTSEMIHPDMSSHLQAQATLAAAHHRHLPISLVPSSDSGARLQKQTSSSLATVLPLAPPPPGIHNNINRLASSPESPLAQQLLAAQTDRTFALTSSPRGTGGNSGGAPPGACIFVHGLPDGYSDSNLRALFESHLHDVVGHQGVVASRVVIEKSTGRSRDFGFVTMSNPEQASIAISRMNGFKMQHGKSLKLEIKKGDDRAPRSFQ